MRIIAGRFKGRRLSVPKGHATRPSTDRVRESIFNILASRIDFNNLHVLDLFCGTGSLGLEALSRGAETAMFVELNRDVLRFAKMNADTLGVRDACEFAPVDAVKFVERSGSHIYDLVFSDPPYRLEGLPDLPAKVSTLLTSDGYHVLEHDRYLDFKAEPGWIDSRAYGRTIVSIFRPTTPSAEDTK